jgi:hypothetical protein
MYLDLDLDYSELTNFIPRMNIMMMWFIQEAVGLKG